MNILTKLHITGLAFICCMFMSCSSGDEVTHDLVTTSDYADLVVLFEKFREFQDIPLGEGVPDYAEEAVEIRWNKLKGFQQRLASIDNSSWTRAEQVDYHLVRAELNGMEFQFRVVRPWARDPSFYLQSQEGAGPTRQGVLEYREIPIDQSELGEFQSRLRAVPEIFEQAQHNLVDGASDFVTLALQHIDEEVAIYSNLIKVLKEHHPDLVEDSKKAENAVKEYGQWLRNNQHRMTSQAGVGKENYNWLMKNVYLFPYTWDEIRTIVELEDNRVVAFQRLEANRNRHLPPIKPVQSQAEYKASVQEALDHIMTFLHEEEIFTVDPFLTQERYFGSWHGFENEWPEKHDYFFNFSHREPVMEEAHEMVGHHFDDLRASRIPHPIRNGYRPYKIATDRHEGFAFALEELLMHAGYLEGRSRRGREIAYEQSAFRTVRALSDVYMHGGDWDLEDAVKYCIANAPHGELLEDSHHLWFEMATTLRGTGHHMLMVLGKVQFIKMFRDRAYQLGDEFVLKEFMDEFFASGSIPMSLIRWEMTGEDDEMKKLLK